MAKEFSVKNNEELSKVMENGSYEISKSIVESIIKNLNTKKKHVHVLSVTCLEDDQIYDITVERRHFAETLEENLPYYIREEQYEDCQRIVRTINDLKNPIVKQRGRPKKS